MRHSESIAQIATALAAATAEFLAIERNRNVEVDMTNGGSYWFSYATLDEIVNKTRPALAKNGLALVQSEVQEEVNRYSDTGVIVDVDRELMMETRLLHSSGEWISNTTPILVSNNANAQQYGSAVTYARRYGYTSLLGLAAEEDDDGNAATGNKVTRATASGSSRSGGRVVSEKQAKLLAFKLKEAGGYVVNLCRHFGIGSIEEVPAARMDEAMKLIAEKHPALLAKPTATEAKAAGAADADHAKTEHLALVAKNGESLNLIRYHLGVVRNAEVDALESEYDARVPARAGQEWLEYSDAEQSILWLAPSKGGWFTTAERDALRKAVSLYHASKTED